MGRRAGRGDIGGKIMVNICVIEKESFIGEKPQQGQGMLFVSSKFQWVNFILPVL